MYKLIIVTIASFLLFGKLNAQIDSLKMDLDLRTRAELDNGNKTLIPRKKNPEVSIHSRVRLGIGYYYKNLTIYLSAQDVRTWGETNSTASKNQTFTLHEAWASYQFNPKFGMKLGRQVLSYDNERLVGALDWAMQGRSFDALKGVYQISPKSKFEAALTYNNDDNDLNDTPNHEIYSIAEAGEITKSMQLIHYQYVKNERFRISAIALNNVLQNPSSIHYDMLSVGFNIKKAFKNVELNGSVYYQTGKNTFAQNKSAYQFSVNAAFTLVPQFNIALGTEWLSGRNYNTGADKNLSFSPLYGTNHAYNGYMDYFYAGVSHFNGYGLNDYYIKTTYKINQKSVLQANVHAFTSNGKLGFNPQGKQYSSYLGTELDIVFTQKIGKYITANLGQSFMIAGESMQYIKNVQLPRNIQSWTWLAVKVNPYFRLK